MLFQKKVEEDHAASKPERGSLAPASNARRTPDGLPPRAIIAAGVNIDGCVQTSGEVQIDGQIHGDVRCTHLTVGATGIIMGDISADEVVIRGKVKGAIRGGRVIIQQSAHVDSDIQHDKLCIEEGAYFKGCSTHNESSEISSTSGECGGATADARTQGGLKAG